MIFIGVVFLAIIGIFIYIYGGLRLSEPITGDTAYLLFWVAYGLLGITIAICILLVFIWGDIHKKVGPPGARGIMGDDGDAGTPGECTAGHSLLGIMYNIREAMQGQFAKRKSSDSADKSIVTDEGKLVNNYMETRLQTIITSSQMKVLLEGGEDKKRGIGKSVNDITGYLSGIWQSWLTGILAKPAGAEFFTSAEALPDLNPEIQQYFTEEVEKYDVWYWGSTQVFRPLEAEVCRQLVVTDPATGKSIPNSNLPMPDRPPLEFIEVEYSDVDTSKLTITYKTDGIKPANPKRASKWSPDSASGSAGLISQPAFAIPKIITQGKKVFYPLGQVIIETVPELKSATKKRTLLVSGDIILPTTLARTWYDAGSTGGKQPGLFYKVSTDVPGYVCLGDLFLTSIDIKPGVTADKITESDTMTYLGYNKTSGKIQGDYKGIVCIPAKCIDSLDLAKIPSWAYKLPESGDKEPNSSINIYESETPAESYNIVRCDKSDPHYKITDKCTLSDLADVPVKELEKEFAELGIGWFGHPVKSNQKYSIFAYLGLMPEGIIVHRNSGSKYYIRHYGGTDLNKYVLVKWDMDSRDYVQTLKANSGETVTIEKGINPANKQEQWSIHPDSENKNYFRLMSVAYPNKYLSLDYDINAGWNRQSNPNNAEDTSLNKVRPRGISVSHQTVIAKLVFSRGVVNASNKTLFYNVPAYGVDTGVNSLASKSVKKGTGQANISLQKYKTLLQNKNNTATVTDRNNPGAELKFTS